MNWWSSKLNKPRICRSVRASRCPGSSKEFWKFGCVAYIFARERNVENPGYNYSIQFYSLIIRKPHLNEWYWNLVQKDNDLQVGTEITYRFDPRWHVNFFVSYFLVYVSDFWSIAFGKNIFHISLFISQKSTMIRLMCHLVSLVEILVKNKAFIFRYNALDNIKTTKLLRAGTKIK